MITYIISALTIGAIFTIFSLALNVRWGWSGDLDLSLIAYVGIGAYVGAVVTAGPSPTTGQDQWILGLNAPFLVALVAAMAVCGGLSLAVGSVALRTLRGDHFAITTLGTTLIAYAVISQYRPLFNGFEGVYGVPQPFQSFLHLDPTLYAYFYFGLCVLAVLCTYVFLELLFRSPFGRALRAVREDEQAAAAFGRNVFWLKLRAYVIGGALAGAGGVLFSSYLGVWNPYAWDISETFLLLGAILIGGSGNLRGVILGNFFIVVLIQEVTRFLPTIPGHEDAAAAIRFIIVGLLILAVLRWRPQGLIPEPVDHDEMHRPAPLEAVGSEVRHD
ncbi:MAG: branched-chain amino acid ABC transporter permease [Candidatus Limnocylindrales bacterium]